MDTTAFEKLYAETWRQILAYALRRTANREDATDVVAEVFAVAWRRRADVPPGREGLLWLFGVARLALANQRRGDLRRLRLAGALRDALPANSPADPADITAGRDEAARVRAALRTLSDLDRELLTLVAWDGLTPAEAAAVTGLTAVATRVRLHRARRRLTHLTNPDATPQPARPTNPDATHRPAPLPNPDATPQPGRTCLPDGRPPVPAEETS